MENQILRYLKEQVLQGDEFYDPSLHERRMYPTRHLVTNLNLDCPELIAALHRLHSLKQVDREWMGMEFGWRLNFRGLPRDPNWRHSWSAPTKPSIEYECPKCGGVQKTITPDLPMHCGCTVKETSGSTRMKRVSK